MKKTINNLIKVYVSEYPEYNQVRTEWGEPLIAYASAEDLLFKEFKKLITPSHKLPVDFLPDAKTVICYFIPFTKSMVDTNINEVTASEEWAVAYVETNKLIKDINNYLENKIKELDKVSTIIPTAHKMDKTALISDWSQRHAAYIAGLGKFGLNRMLITEKGCCGRFGSLVTNVKIEPTPRSDSEFCLYKHNNSCKLCIERCVKGAIKTDSFDRHKCYEACLYNKGIYRKVGKAAVCGKCLANVPCSFTNPVGKLD